MLRGVASTVGFVTGISTAIVAFDDNLSTTTTLTTFLKRITPVVHAYAKTVEHNILFPAILSNVNTAKPVIPTLTSSLSLAEQSYYLDDICAFGLPSVENVVIRRPYVSSVNFRTKCPNWVAEHYTNLNTEDSHDLSPSKISRKGIEFKGDVALPKPFRALPADYVNTGYSRGHLATAASHNRRDLDLLETFLLTSNIVPQDNTMNEGDWAKLENLTRQLCKHYSHVRTITGPLYLPTMHEGRQVVQYDVLGKNQIHIPTHLFKVVYLTGPMKPLSGDAVVAKGATNFRVPNTQPLTLQQLQQPPTPAMTSPRHYGDTTVSVIAFAMPNNAESVDNPMSSYVIPLAAIERASGLCLTPRGTPNSITMTTSIRD